MTNKQGRDVLLKNLPSLVELKCDVMLEMYILEMIEKTDMLPNLKLINRVALDIKNLPERNK